MVIDGNTIPVDLAARGTYQFRPPEILIKNGKGLPVTGGTATLTWTFSFMTQAEWDFWSTTVLGGAPGKECSGLTQLYDHDKTLTTFTRCVVLRPEWDRIENGLFRDVVVTIEQIA